MWCDWCSDITLSVQTTVRLDKDGHETVIEYCDQCMRRTETVFNNSLEIGRAHV